MLQKKSLITGLFAWFLLQVVLPVAAQPANTDLDHESGVRAKHPRQ